MYVIIKLCMRESVRQKQMKGEKELKKYKLKKYVLYILFILLLLLFIYVCNRFNLIYTTKNAVNITKPIIIIVIYEMTRKTIKEIIKK